MVLFSFSFLCVVRKRVGVVYWVKVKVKVWGEWPSGLKCCRKNQMVPGSNPTKHLAGLGPQPRYEAPSDLWVENVKCSD